MDGVAAKLKTKSVSHVISQSLRLRPWNRAVRPALPVARHYLPVGCHLPEVSAASPRSARRTDHPPLATACIVMDDMVQVNTAESLDGDLVTCYSYYTKYDAGETLVELRVDPSVASPLHRQIVDQIRHQVASGKLAPRRPAAAGTHPRAGAGGQRQHRGQGLRRAGALRRDLHRPGQGQLRGRRRPSAGWSTSGRTGCGTCWAGRCVEALSLGYSLEQIEGALALQWARWRELRSDRAGRGLQSVDRAIDADTVLRIAGSHDLALDLLIGQLRRVPPRAVRCLLQRGQPGRADGPGAGRGPHRRAATCWTRRPGSTTSPSCGASFPGRRWCWSIWSTGSRG